MQLPSELQHFPNGALIVASDSVHASFYLLGGDSLEELNGVEVPREHMSDAEGEKFSADGTRVIGLENDNLEEERLRRFTEALRDRLQTYVVDHQIPHIHFVMPAEIEHQLSAKLPAEVASRVGIRVHANLLNEPAIEIVRRVVAEMR